MEKVGDIKLVYKHNIHKSVHGLNFCVAIPLLNKNNKVIGITWKTETIVKHHYEKPHKGSFIDVQKQFISYRNKFNKECVNFSD